MRVCNRYESDSFDDVRDDHLEANKRLRATLPNSLNTNVYGIYYTVSLWQVLAQEQLVRRDLLLIN